MVLERDIFTSCTGSSRFTFILMIFLAGEEAHRAGVYFEGRARRAIFARIQPGTARFRVAQQAAFHQHQAAFVQVLVAVFRRFVKLSKLVAQPTRLQNGT